MDYQMFCTLHHTLEKPLPLTRVGVLEGKGKGLALDARVLPLQITNHVQAAAYIRVRIGGGLS